jgi:alkanesulfonate monooxygenase SsuD/methylene tetrahydromethanopterin reductase-like flavin-dependent oxidoreductase (luciferase family)
MRFGYGLITAQHHPNDRRTDVEIYREAIALAVEVERLGFDSVWTSEHHFVDDGYMPSQLPVLAAIASRTDRILLGTGVLLAPMFDPLHLAEDAATVDLLSDGRLVLGLGLGWRDEEFAGLGGASGHKGRRLAAIIEILRDAWSDGLVQGGGHGLYRYPGAGLNVTPKPARPGGQPIWIGGGATPALERAGQVADGYLSSRIAPDGLAARLRTVHDAAVAAGRDPSEVTRAAHVPVFAWTDGDAWGRVRDAAHYMTWKYTDMADAHGSRARRLPPTLSAEEEVALRNRVIAGTPSEVAAGIGEYLNVLGPDGHFIARSYFPGLDPAVQLESLRILGEEVLPLVRAS